MGSKLNLQLNSNKGNIDGSPAYRGGHIILPVPNAAGEIVVVCAMVLMGTTEPIERKIPKQFFISHSVIKNENTD